MNDRSRVYEIIGEASMLMVNDMVFDEVRAKELAKEILSEFDKLKKQVEILKGACDESLAIIAHVDPEIYSSSTANRMVVKELLKALKEVSLL